MLVEFSLQTFSWFNIVINVSIALDSRLYILAKSIVF